MVTRYTGMRDQANDSVASAIAQHLKEAAALMAAQSTSSAGGSINEAEIIARLDLILMKLDAPVVPLEQQLWTLAEVAAYFGRHVVTVRESMACLPSFPPAIHLPGRGAGRGKALYNAGEVIEWAKTYQEKQPK